MSSNVVLFTGKQHYPPPTPDQQEKLLELIVQLTMKIWVADGKCANYEIDQLVQGWSLYKLGRLSQVERYLDEITRGRDGDDGDAA